LADLVSADNDALEQIAGSLLNQLDLERRTDAVQFERKDLEAEPLALRRRLLRQAIARVRGDLVGVTFDMIETVLADPSTGPNRCITLPSSGAGPVRLLSNHDSIRIVRETPPAAPVPWLVELRTPGCTRLERVGISIETAFCADGKALEEFQRAVAPVPMRAHWIVLRRDDVVTPLIARSWRPGDRIRRRAGQRKLQDLFVDAHVPAAQRMDVPVLTDQSGRLLAVIGLEVSDTGLTALEADPDCGWLAVIVRPIGP
jgi:tRNA(Ile)-lysidine synthetase-like protein